MSLQGQRVLVTGGAGVIGRELLRLLRREGAVVLSIDREELVDADLAGTPHLRIDLAEADLAPLIEFDPHVVVHLAAAFERSKESPGFWPVNWHDNILCSHRVVDLMPEMTALETFVFASSYLVYDPSTYLSVDAGGSAVPLHESSEKETRNVTGAAKLYTEAELDFVTEYLRPDVRTVFARICRVYGRGSRDIISRWIRAALAGESVELYNSQNEFDYVFAADVAEGLLRMAIAEQASGAVNLSTGCARTVREAVEAIEAEVPGFASRVRDRGTIEHFERSVADVTRLGNLVGWVPQMDLRTGVARIVEYERAVNGG